MRANDAHLRQVEVDGQLLLLPDAEGWERLLALPEVDDVPVGVVDRIVQMLPFVQQHPELALALVRPVPTALAWLPIELLRLGDRWQRVYLERLRCPVCGWYGMTANPTIPPLYIGVPDRPARVRASFDLPVVPCPQCGSTLPRYPIWVEPSIS